MTASIAMGPGSVIDNEGGIYIGVLFGRLTISGDVNDQIINNGTIAAARQMVIGLNVVGNGSFEMGANDFIGQPSEAKFQGRVGPVVQRRLAATALRTIGAAHAPGRAAPAIEGEREQGGVGSEQQ